MTTLEDRILGEKRQYYCSSSESENEESDEEKETTDVSCDVTASTSSAVDNSSGNTGPKGVIKDWQKFKELETEKRAKNKEKELALMQKLSLTCRSALDEEQEKLDAEFSDLLADGFLLEYRKQRMQEMLSKVSNNVKFGTVVHITSPQDFLDAVDKEDKSVTVLVHIYDEKVAGCRVMNQCLNSLCRDYPEVKFCKIHATTAGVSKHFKDVGVPALLIYKSGNLVGNYIKLTEELGEEFCTNDVENFLIEMGMIQDKSCVPSIIQSRTLNSNDNN